MRIVPDFPGDQQNVLSQPNGSKIVPFRAKFLIKKVIILDNTPIRLYYKKLR
jgi:hypothetical protein